MSVIYVLIIHLVHKLRKTLCFMGVKQIQYLQQQRVYVEATVSANFTATYYLYLHQYAICHIYVIT